MNRHSPRASQPRCGTCDEPACCVSEKAAADTSSPVSLPLVTFMNSAQMHTRSTPCLGRKSSDASIDAPNNRTLRLAPAARPPELKNKQVLARTPAMIECLCPRKELAGLRQFVDLRPV